MASSLDRRSSRLRGAGRPCTDLYCYSKARGQTFPCIAAPGIDKLVIRVIVNGAHDTFSPEQRSRRTLTHSTLNLPIRSASEADTVWREGSVGSGRRPDMDASRRFIARRIIDQRNA